MSKLSCRARFLAAVVLSLALAGAAAGQEKPQPLSIGGKNVLYLRAGDTLNGKTETIEDRIARVQDVFAKHLGGKKGKVTSKKVGERIHLSLNGDFVLAVTPADARVGGYKSVQVLAEAWQKALEKAFKASSAEK